MHAAWFLPQPKLVSEAVGGIRFSQKCLALFDVSCTLKGLGEAMPTCLLLCVK